MTLDKQNPQSAEGAQPRELLEKEPSKGQDDIF